MSKATIDRFYTAFEKKDWRTMQACYDDDATFNDPVFQQLSARHARAMWRMLLSSDASIEITYSVISATANKVRCHWEAKYKFSATGRDVHNIIEAEFHFKDEKIVDHIDRFNLWRWSGMALGLSGKLLGWSAFMRNKIRGTAQKRLFQFIQEHPEYK